ncbi:hypothetical protein ABD76_03215 [Paenibacillus dendritiformis]|nr:hypothetical protein [Paenibacillus dendritiformis]
MTMMDWDLSEYEDPNVYDLENQGNPELPMVLEWATLNSCICTEAGPAHPSSLPLFRWWRYAGERKGGG